MANLGRGTLAALLLLVVSVFGQLGCDRIDIESGWGVRGQSDVAPRTVLTPGAKLHDLALIAIDFDPALKPGLLPASDNITLLVAIENRGNQIESDAVVEATLRGLPGSEVLVSSQGVIKEIVPGESLVLRFGNFSSIPLRSAYSLTVDVHPVSGEVAIENNSRSYRLEVTVTSR